MANLDKGALHQRWMHSREEDTDTEIMFRPANYNFPRSRGRTGFELKNNGKLIEIGTAPTDAQQEAEGTWRLEADNKLAFYRGSESEPSQVLQILSADKHLLITKK